MNIPDKKTAYGEVPDHFRLLVATAIMEEEKPMKRKISVGLVLAIVLILAAVTALSVAGRFGVLDFKQATDLGADA